MTSIETIRQGAAANRRATPRTAMDELIKVRQGTDAENERFQRWEKIVKKNDEYLSEVLLYTFNNWSLSLGRSRRAADRQQYHKQRDARVSDIVDKIRSSVLDLIMPNGKRLGLCTREELLQINGRCQRIAARLQPGQTVEDGLTEKQALKLWNGEITSHEPKN